MSNPLLSIVIPVFNSELSIPELFDSIRKSMESGGISYEIIAVNDGSTDNSWKKLTNQTLVYDQITAIDLEKNYGQQAATLCGIIEAKGEYVVTIDDDLEYHPEDIKTLLFAIDKTNCKIIYGCAEKRGRSQSMNTISNIAKKIVYGISGLSSNISSFRIIRGKVTEELKEINSSYFLIDGLLKKSIKDDHSYVTVKQSKRRYGKSNYNLRSLIIAWIRFLFSSSRFGSYFALILLVIIVFLLLAGNVWLTLVLGVIAIILTYLTLTIRWTKRKSFSIKEKVRS